MKPSRSASSTSSRSSSSVSASCAARRMDRHREEAELHFSLTRLRSGEPGPSHPYRLVAPCGPAIVDRKPPAGPARSRRRRHGTVQRTRSHRGGDRAARRVRRPALQDGHDRADPPPARLRARGRADRGRVAEGDPVSHRGRPGLQRPAPGVHPALGHARRLDPGRCDQPPPAERRGRIDRARPVLLGGRA